MRNPNNVVTVDQNDTDYEFITITNLEPVNEEVYDLMDEKDIKKYFADIERTVRTSFEYRKYISYLRENFDMTKCSIYENVSNADTLGIKIHIHHEPITLYDIVVTIYNKRKFFHEDLSIFMVAKEVMYVHYCLMIGLIPLSETVHELVHNQYLFIPTTKVFGHYKEFIRQYNDFLPDGLEATLNEIEKASENYEDQLQVLEKHYIYLDTSEFQKEADLSKLEQDLRQRIYDIKNGVQTPIVEEQKLICPVKRLEK